MTRLLVLVEGATEELFVERLLAPHLQNFGVFARSTGVENKRLASGKKITGGNLWTNVRHSLLPLLADTDAWVTTLLDFYGLPADFPGAADALTISGEPQAKVRHIENRLAEAVGRPDRFLPFLILHEFEAWYFTNPGKVADYYGKPSVAVAMTQACIDCGGAENINHGKDSHPSRRLESYRMGFRKTSAVAVLAEIGLETIRRDCSHFNTWLQRLENLGAEAGTKRDGLLSKQS